MILKCEIKNSDTEFQIQKKSNLKLLFHLQRQKKTPEQIRGQPKQASNGKNLLFGNRYL